MDAKGRLCIPVLWRRRELNYLPKASNSNKVAGTHEICTPIYTPKLRGDYFLPLACLAPARMFASIFSSAIRFRIRACALGLGIGLAASFFALATSRST